MVRGGFPVPAATHPAKVGNLTVTPSLAGHGGFGLYHFDVTPVNAGDSFAFPFLTGSKIGHCVEATVLANNNTSTLRTDNDLSLANGDAANTLGTGLTTGAQRVMWILLDAEGGAGGQRRDFLGNTLRVRIAHHSWQDGNEPIRRAGR